MSISPDRNASVSLFASISPDRRVGACELSTVSCLARRRPLFILSISPDRCEPRRPSVGISTPRLLTFRSPQALCENDQSISPDLRGARFVVGRLLPDVGMIAAVFFCEHFTRPRMAATRQRVKHSSDERSAAPAQVSILADPRPSSRRRAFRPTGPHLSKVDEELKTASRQACEHFARPDHFSTR